MLVFSSNKVKLKKKEDKMSISGKVKWFNGTKVMVSLKETTKKKMFLYILQQLEKQT